MPDPSVQRLGNLRLAGVPITGWPEDPLALVEEVRAAIGIASGEPAPAAVGPACLWWSLPPERLPPAQWDGIAGCAITGLPSPGTSLPDGTRMLVEDYRMLVAWSLAHVGPARDLPLTWRRLADAASAANRRLRPYWRVLLRARTLADGSLLPQVEVQVFVEP